MQPSQVEKTLVLYFLILQIITQARDHFSFLNKV